MVGRLKKSDLDAYTKKQEFIFYIQEIGYFKAPIPYYTERAHLPSYLIKFTLSGKGSLTYNDNQQQLKAGDLFFIDCQEYQRYQTISEEPWEMDWIHLNGQNVQSFYQEFTKDGHNTFHSTGDPSENKIHH